jgi:hypothetical protein
VLGTRRRRNDCRLRDPIAVSIDTVMKTTVQVRTAQLIVGDAIAMGIMIQREWPNIATTLFWILTAGWISLGWIDWFTWRRQGKPLWCVWR